MSTKRSQGGIRTWRVYTQKNVNNNGVNFVSSPTYVSYTWWDQFTGTELPNWKQILSNGGDATTPMSGVKYTFSESSSGTMKVIRSGPRHAYEEEYTITGSWYTYYGFSTLSANATTANNQALTSLYTQLRQTKSLFDGMVAIGELRSTIGMMVSPLNTLRKTLANYFTNLRKRSAGKKAEDLKRVITDTYLEFIFGWTPAASDLMKLIEIANGITKRRTNVRIVARGSNSVADDWNAQTMDNNYIYYIAQTSRNSEVSVQYVVGYRPSEFDADPTIAALYGFTPERFLPTVYELLPYSWVIDYFSNIGKLIDAYTTLSYSPIYISKTTRERKVRTMTFAPDAAKCKQVMGSTFIGISGSLGTSISVVTSVDRVKLTNLPLPTLEFKLPGVQQAVNIGAVLGQLVNLQSSFSKRQRKFYPLLHFPTTRRIT